MAGVVISGRLGMDLDNLLLNFGEGDRLECYFGEKSVIGLL